MSELYLSKVDQSNDSKGDIVWSATETVGTAGNGSTILLPDGAGKVDTWILDLCVTSGSGKMQWTVDESLTRWNDWSPGVVTVDASDVLYGVKAVRAVNVSGIVEIYVRAY